MRIYIPWLSNKISKFKKESKTFLNPKNIDNSLEILEIVINVLNNHNIKYYLDFGTLLGAMRDNALIPWDDDIDITLFNEEDYHKIHYILRDIRKAKLKAWTVSFYRSILNRKLKIKKDSSISIFVDKIEFTDPFNPRIAVINNRNCFKKSKSGKNNLDIFFKYKNNNSLFWMVENRIHSMPSDILGTELIEIDFYNLKCNIPKNYDEYLTYIYGDWKTPKKDWQYYENETCTKENKS